MTECICKDFTGDIASLNVIQSDKIPSQKNPSGMGTKPLPLSNFKSCLSTLNIDTI